MELRIAVCITNGDLGKGFDGETIAEDGAQKGKGELLNSISN